MSEKKEGIVLFLALVITSAILAGGYWWLTKKGGVKLITNNEEISNNSNINNQENSEGKNPFPIPEKIAAGTTIIIDGSTSMVTINEGLKKAFSEKFPTARILTQAKGSSEGIISLVEGTIDLAAVSRPLEEREKSLDLGIIPVTKDAISIMVGIENPICRKGLTEDQVKDIFQGKLTKWSKIGGNSEEIKVINRPPISGTHRQFKELVLKGENFGITNNIKTKDRDETTGIIQELGNNGISYATYQQVKNQSTACSLAINGQTPESENYPYFRTLFYIYKKPATESVKAFLGFLNTPEAKEIINN